MRNIAKWEYVTLGELVELRYGKAFKAEDRPSDGVFPIYGSNGIVGQSHTPLVEHPTIIIGRKGAVGEAHLAKNGCWPIDTTFYTVTKPDRQISLKYLLLWLYSFDLKQLAITSTIPGINRDTLYAQKVPLPPLVEQERLIRLLDEADALRRLRARADGRMADFVPALFHEMFGDPARGSKQWELVRVEEAVDLINGRAFKPTDWRKSGRPIIRIQNLHDSSAPLNYFEGHFDSKHRVEPGDLLLSWSGQLVSFGVQVWRGPSGILNQHIFNVKPKMLFELTYLEQALGHIVEMSKQKFHGIEMKHVTKSTLNSYTLLYPPLSLQREFAGRVTEARALEKKQAQSKARLEALFESMLARAFAGEL